METGAVIDIFPRMTRLQWAPHAETRQGLRARKGPLYADIWLAEQIPGGDRWMWSVYAVLRERGWCGRSGTVSSRHEASDAANAAIPEVEAELAERFPDFSG